MEPSSGNGLIFFWVGGIILIALIILCLVIVIWLMDLECEELSQRVEVLEGIGKHDGDRNGESKEKILEGSSR